MIDRETYLIWSNTHRQWRAAFGRNYSPRLREARRYTRTEALEITSRSIPELAQRHGLLVEIPVRLEDLSVLHELYRVMHPNLPRETWE
jgi:hypothetical protein